MKQRIIFNLISVTILGLSLPSISYAQDAPNVNVTKRRPDRPASFSPSPVGARQASPVQPDIKQVESSPAPSFFARLWLSLKSFFQNFFK